MRKAKAVIGANFGDEGKGLVTDFLACEGGKETLVVRFNGGAQAGHTVATPDGRRHVFSHVGSGTLAGAATLLSRFFVVNPLLFAKERAGLAALGVEPVLFVDPRCPVTTPFDMLINQCAEESRGVCRHGSCGLGFGETIERGQDAAFALTYADLFDAPRLRRRLARIRDLWTPRRLAALGFAQAPSPWADYIAAPGVLENYLADVEFFLQKTRLAPDDILRRERPIVFEGAQGLLLDPAYGWFPHVTRSATGLENVAALCAENGVEEVEAFYLSRAYLTRHGAGPLTDETEGLIYPGIVDPTNKPNPFQGSLRFAPLDLDQLCGVIAQDLQKARGWVAVTPSLAMTCLDQVAGPLLCRHEGGRQELCATAVLSILAGKIGPRRFLLSHGPTRQTVGG